MTLGKHIIAQISAVLVVVLFVSITSAFAEPRLDATTDESFQQSWKEVKESLAPQDLAQFGRATEVLLFHSLDISAVQHNQKEAFQSSFQRFKTLVDGKTGREVVALAAETPANPAKFSVLFANPTQPKEPDSSTVAASSDFLSGIVLGQPTWERRDHFDARASVSITNNTAYAISSIWFKTVLREPGRSIPWDESQGIAPIRGGIEPGETKTITMVILQGFPDEAPEHSVLELEITNVYGAEDTELYPREGK